MKRQSEVNTLENLAGRPGFIIILSLVLAVIVGLGGCVTVNPPVEETAPVEE
ncbi:unnamed protein product [marine sediment metagenome]|uniref:Uncharacterized protein n=1 Tax=marine sediment metagenome TaxID=412755 RepID=X1THC7_9ZZZZ